MILPGIDEEFLKTIQVVDFGYTEGSIPKTFKQYEDWVSKDFHGPLNYLSDYRKDIRSDLKKVYPEFESALVFLFDYTPEKKRLNELNPKNKIASYVSGFEGIDYHYWIKEKLELTLAKLKEIKPTLEAFFSIDAQPVLERDLAYRAGLGWFGKNTMLISKKHGSFNIIGSILLNQKLDIKIEQKLEPDHCGNCTACLDNCPTEAIVDNKVVDANKCISTYTIELFKDAEPPEGYPTQSNEIYGCDICQEVCPWNNKPLQRAEPSKYIAWTEFFNRTSREVIEDLDQMSNRQYRKEFAKTPLERTGRIGMVKNLDKLKQS